MVSMWLLALGTSMASPAPHNKTAGGLSLRLDGCWLLHLDSAQPPEITVRCEARWRNETGAPVQARSVFGAPVDGLYLVARSPQGQTLARQSAGAIRSPLSMPEAVWLPVGDTAISLAFSLSGLSLHDIGTVHLEGALEAGGPWQVTDGVGIGVFR